MIRIVLAISFILHGMPKLTNTARMAGFFGEIAPPFPYQLVLLIGFLDVVGGIQLLVGFGTQINSPLLVASKQWIRLHLNVDEQFTLEN
ncbi:MAG TPA: DoxX family protein [Bacillota bacterium]|nr:DoxX family protein [Bacillota bacterium]